MNVNDPISQINRLRNRGFLILPVDGQLPSVHIPFYSRELSSEELLK